MARQRRVGVAGGLYHVITRGNNRQPIFAAADDYQKFLTLLEKQKQHLPFFVYAYCLMSNQIADLQRQVNREAGAFAGFACGGDATVVLIDYLLHDREAQTGAALFG